MGGIRLRTFPFLVVLMMLLAAASTVVARPPEAAQNGLSNACARSGSDAPCRFARIIENITVGTGETQTYEDGSYQAEGTIIVASGGTVLVDNATITFQSTSAGIIVQPGGTLIVRDSVLRESDEGSEYGIDAQATSSLTLNETRVSGGSGVRIATENADVSGNLLEEIPVAMRLVDVSVTIHHNRFVNNTVSVNQTGGAPTLTHNRFEGGAVCVRDWLSDPTIVHNVFRGCHVGIYHHRSESTLSFNDMEDQANPPGGGIVVEDTMSPMIEGNRIANYGTGILIVNARAYIRGNNISGNVGDGVRIERNSAPMDITQNLIAGNGGNGVTLLSTADVSVVGNVIDGNGGEGVFASDAARLLLQGNNMTTNARNGTLLAQAPGALVEENRADGNGARGFRIEPGSEGLVLRGNRASSNGWHGFSLESDALTLEANHGNENAGAGFWIGNATGVSLAGDIGKRNRIVGFYVLHADHVNATDVTGNDNGDWGYVIVGGGHHAVLRGNASGNRIGFVVNDQSSQTPAEVTLSFARAIGNKEDGLHGTIHANRTIVSAQSGWWEDNGAHGVINSGPQAAVIDARNGYWGSPNGPTHPDNPDGDGDAVSGNVQYDPYSPVPPSEQMPLR